MTYKHLLVHVDGGERALERLDLAVKLAQRWNARLTGLSRRCCSRTDRGPSGVVVATAPLAAQP